MLNLPAFGLLQCHFLLKNSISIVQDFRKITSQMFKANQGAIQVSGEALLSVTSIPYFQKKVISEVKRMSWHAIRQ